MTALLRRPAQELYRYGAVELRRFASRHTLQGFAIAVFGFSVLCLLALTSFSSNTAVKIPSATMPNIIEIMPYSPPVKQKAIAPSAPANTPKSQKMDGGKQKMPKPSPALASLVPSTMQSDKNLLEPTFDEDPDLFQDKEGMEEPGQLGTIGDPDGEPGPNVLGEFPREGKTKADHSLSPFGSANIVEILPSINTQDLQTLIVYPEIARLSGMEGEVLIRVLIDRDGVAVKTLILQSTDDIFDNSAIQAVMKARYTPAQQNGQTVPCWVNIPIKFNIR